MRKLLVVVIVTVILITVTSIITPNSTLIYKRILIDKYAFSLSNRIKDFKYNFNLTVRGESNSYPTWNINTSKNNFIKIQNQVLSILDNYLVSGEQFGGTDTNYSAQVIDEYGNKTKAKLKLFGMNPDHYRDSKSHSFRLTYKNGISFGKRKENFLKPVTRTYGIDYMWNILFSEYAGGIKIDYKPIRILFNNIDYGFYYKEPFFDKYLIELNGFRDGEIFEMYPDSINVNHLPESKDYTDFQPLSKYTRDEINQLVDVSSIYDVVGISILSGSNHCILDINLHWYHNPVINRIQPTLREIGSSNIQLKTDVFGNIIDLESIVENFVQDNSIINSIYLSNKTQFVAGVTTSLKKFVHSFEEDKILENPELISFLNLNPTNQKFYEYYNRIKNNISFVKPYLTITSKVSDHRETTIIRNSQLFKRDTIIRNKRIIFEGNNEYKISDNAMIKFENSEVIFGNENFYSSFSGEENNSGSIFFENSDVKIYNMGFSNLKSPNPSIPAAITFYNCNVSIDNATFSDNIIGDDFLNFFRCPDVSVINSNFNNVNSDAIDSDFSNISIVNNKFMAIGNDAIDLSGSASTINRNIFSNVEDKCISLGEQTIASILNNSFKNSELALVIKDGSVITSSNNMFSNNKIDYVFFNKKPIFGPPIIDKINENVYFNVLAERDINLENIMGKYDIRIESNVESLLYGREYGKSSK